MTATNENENGRAIAWDREETDACQKGTPGCAIDHAPGDDEGCETW